MNQKRAPGEKRLRQYVEKRGGVYFGSFPHPLTQDEGERYWSFKTPPGMLKCSAVWHHKVEYLYALPAKWMKARSRAVAPVPEYAPKEDVA